MYLYLHDGDRDCDFSWNALASPASLLCSVLESFKIPDSVPKMDLTYLV